MEPSYEETYIDRHFRVVKVTAGNDIIYSIDYYNQLESPPPCDSWIEVEGYRLCYKKLRDCTVLIADSRGRIEAISLRLHTTPDKDPGPEAARRKCIGEADSLLEGMLVTQRG